MKKLAVVIMTGLIMAAAMSGCGGSETANVDLTAVVASIDSSYPNEMVDITTVEDLNKYYGIAQDDVKNFAAEYSKSGVDEVVLVEAVDADAAQKVSEALQNRYNSKKQQGASYSAEDLQVINNCSVKTNGNFVSMIVSSDATAMEEIYTKALNG